MTCFKSAGLTGILFCLLMGPAWAQPPIESADELVATHAELGLAQAVNTYQGSTGANVDVLLDAYPCEEICGITLIIKGSPCSPPFDYYTGNANPWGSPTSVVETPVGSGNWLVTFGGRTHEDCIRVSDLLTKNGSPYVHFGYRVKGKYNLLNPATGLYNIGYIVHCIDGSYTGYGLPGHSRNGGRIRLNAVDRDMVVANVQIANADYVSTNNLRADLLPELNWSPVPLEQNIITQEGLDVEIPQDLLSDPSLRVIMSYDIVDPDTGETRSNITLDFPVSED
jgi:hypothetical protein